MPKAKPSQVIVHRIELQETERATLEAALAGRFVTNGVSAVGSVFSGIGAALAPFSGVFSALAALWIADRTIEEIQDSLPSKEDLEGRFHEDGALLLARVAGWLHALYAEGGWDAICPSSQEAREQRAQELMAMTGIYQGLNAWAFNPLNPNALPSHANPLGDVVAPSWFINDVLGVFLSTVCDDDNVMAKQQNPVDLWTDFYTVEQYGRDRYYHGQQTYPKPIRWFFGWD